MNQLETYSDTNPDVGAAILAKSHIGVFVHDSLRRISWSYICWLLAASGISYLIYITTRNEIDSSIKASLLCYYIVLSFHVAYRFARSGRWAFLAPDVLFIMFYTIVHLGYVTLYGFGVVPFAWEVFYYKASIPKALLIVNIGLVGFLFGFEILGSSRLPQHASVISIPGWSWGITGKVIIAAAIAMHYYGLTMLGFGTIMNYGYNAIQNVGKYTSYSTALMLSMSKPLMAFGLVVSLITSAFRHGKLFHSKIVLAATVLFIATVILEGDRGPVLSLAIPILLVRHYFIKRVKIRYLIVAFLALSTLFAGMAIVRTTVFKPGEMLDKYKDSKRVGDIQWYSSFVELGGSFLVVDIVAEDVPSKSPYWKGASWRSSAIHIIPFAQGYVLRTGYARWSPSEWITITYFGQNASGRGFTIAAEGYLNFGLPGTFIELMMIGLFIRWLTVKFSRNPSGMWAFIMLACLGPMVLVSRNHLNLVTNVCVQIFVIGYLMKLFLGSTVYGVGTEQGYSDLTSNDDMKGTQ
ncbi:MAG: oligosaccharide repeat unit polymerase [Anaerohalosphaera sp.]|nr:oligosaccharide repeat unit polymerase [Anaerohalosphaera sp.]